MVAFGTSGLRGLATDLLAGPGYAYAHAFASYLRLKYALAPGSTVLVGCDRRESSPELTRQVLAALTDAGLSPAFCGILPTPALALRALDIAAPAVMVTGSHIPADRNGLKFYRADGEIDKADELAIAAGAQANTAARPGGELPTLPQPDGQALSAYMERYRAAFPEQILRGKRIGVYEHSSVAAGVLRRIMEALGAEIIPLGQTEGFVAIDTEAIDEATAERLSGWSRELALDAIVSTDGDGDRPLLTDEAGAVIRGDVLGLVSADVLGADVIVTPVSSNPGIESRFASQVVRTKVGSPYVLEGMATASRDHRRVIGFEANGGLLVGTPVEINGARLAPLPTRDSILPMLCMFAEAHRRDVPLSTLVALLNLPVCISGRVENFARADSDRLMSALRGSTERQKAFLNGIGSYTRSIDIDGLQIYLDDGSMIHLRPSGNAPEMRCYVSAASAERAAELLRFGLDAIKQSPQTFRE
jgi:phosphomannomutase